MKTYQIQMQITVVDADADGVGWCEWCWMQMVKADIVGGVVDDSALVWCWDLETFVQVCAATIHY